MPPDRDISKIFLLIFRLNTWMDANALFYGTFDVKEQKKQLLGQAIDGPKE